MERGGTVQHSSQLENTFINGSTVLNIKNHVIATLVKYKPQNAVCLFCYPQ